MNPLPDLFKCSTCYKTFTTPKNDGVGNLGCPSCGSHKFESNLRDEFPYKYFCQNCRGITGRDTPASNISDFKCCPKPRPISYKHVDELRSIGKSVQEVINQTINNTFELIGQKVGQLVDKKNTQYGSAFLKGVNFFELLYPNGIPPEKYIHALLTIRVFDKLIRIATCSDETEIESPWEDIAGYGILGHSVWSRK